MTHAERIVRGVAAVLKGRDRKTFSRSDVREELGIDRSKWNASFNPIFQGMRIDQPGGAPLAKAAFRGVFRQVSRGRYALTPRGQHLVDELPGSEQGSRTGDGRAISSSSGMRQVIIYPGEDRFWVVECPSLPGCVSQGRTKKEAIANVREAIRGYVGVLEADGLPVPEERFEALLLAV